MKAATSFLPRGAGSASLATAGDGGEQMALLGPDSNQIAREVWAEQQGWRQEQEYMWGGREPLLCHLSGVLPVWGPVGALAVASVWSLNLQMLGASL